MMKKIISFIMAGALILSLAIVSVFAVEIEAGVSDSIEPTIETTVAPTISEDYIPSETLQTPLNSKKIELSEHLIICEYEKPTTKKQAQNRQDGVKEYTHMIYDMLPEQYDSLYAELYLMARPSLDSAQEVFAQYQKDIDAFVKQEKIEAEAKRKKQAKKKAEQEAKKEQSSDNSNLKYLDRFTLTAYCNCKKCCGKWAGGPTAIGKMPKQGRTIAVDPKVIPLGTKVVIDGKTYTAEDTGSAIKGKKIDIYFSSHSEALKFGRQSAKVYIVKD